uniref:Uncharacterized protein n=1 Tax=Promethearchaeum syntrophicum TaxID=2594042 RepID=A0A5B9DCX9_9ARCH|nr:hypothetical protein DSAG12_02816 [Candidatus Prometheoarchaeum syntrophicum]
MAKNSPRKKKSEINRATKKKAAKFNTIGINDKKK